MSACLFTEGTGSAGVEKRLAQQCTCLTGRNAATGAVEQVVLIQLPDCSAVRTFHVIRINFEFGFGVDDSVAADTEIPVGQGGIHPGALWMYVDSSVEGYPCFISTYGVKGLAGSGLAGSVLNGAAAVRIRQFHLALGGALLDHGTDPANFPVGGLPPGTEFKERMGSGSLVYRFGIIALGGTVKYVRTTVDTVQERAVSGDAGIAIAIFDILAFGFSIQNLGGNWRGDSGLDMPRLSRL